MAIRDNELKKKQYGSIIDYPWGAEYASNQSPIHAAILHYPMLNELSVALWALSVANLGIGNTNESKYWINKIINEIPLHQIPAVKEDKEKGEDGTLIIGYWNALLSWEDNIPINQIDKDMQMIYREVLKERGMSSVKSIITSQKVRILVLDFNNILQSKDLDYLSKLIPNSLTSSISNSKDVGIITLNDNEVYSNYSQLKTQAIPNDLKNKIIFDIAERKNVDFVIAGGFFEFDNFIHINTKIFNIATKNVLRLKEIDADLNKNIFLSFDQLSKNIIDYVK